MRASLAVLLMPLLGGCVACALAGCAAVANEVEDSVVAWQRVGKVIKSGKPNETAYKSAYCYRTLADVDCYDTPQQGQEFRFAGYTAIPLQAQNVHYHTAPVDIAPAPVGDTSMTYAPPVVESSNLAPPDDGTPTELMNFQIGDQTYSADKMPSQQQLDAQGL